MKFRINLSVSTSKAGLGVDWDDLESTNQLGVDLFMRFLPLISVLAWSFRIQSTNTEIFRTIRFYADLKLVSTHTYIDYKPPEVRVIGASVKIGLLT